MYATGTTALAQTGAAGSLTGFGELGLGAFVIGLAVLSVGKMLSRVRKARATK